MTICRMLPVAVLTFEGDIWRFSQAQFVLLTYANASTYTSSLPGIWHQEVSRAMIRLTKTAYVQQNERESNVYSVRNSKDCHHFDRKSDKVLVVGLGEQKPHHRSASNRKSFVPNPIAKLGHLMEEDAPKKKHPGHKADTDDAELASHLIQKNPGCTLFTLVSAESNPEVSANMSAKEASSKFGRECCDSICSGPTAIENRKDKELLTTATESSVEIDKCNCPCAHKEANSHVMFAVKRNLRHHVPTSSFANVNTNLSVHRDGLCASQLQKSARLSRSPARIVAVNRQEFSKESKHADIVSNTEILEQARKYGSWNFVSRLTREINRGKTRSGNYFRHSQDGGVDLLPDERLTNLDYADDKVLLFDNFQAAQTMLDAISFSAKYFGMRFAVSKCNVSLQDCCDYVDLMLDNVVMEVVDWFVYLGSYISGGGAGVRNAIEARISKAKAVFANLGHLCRQRGISLKLKGRVYKTMVRAVLIYGSETWRLRQGRRREPSSGI
ncbi:uncharacterized protein DEA37_0013326 [Paragonimus westermani]|uniref:Reverse transcriptase domain-containing protein n=1 Tax=Paragonimus westermani TaxID=34504 RepID=A0A5J4NTV6_9TREM|nr:uncharacterized protein DEA37_0013326 [Paragonimus westermani]